jgi:hypothetical protein
VNLWGVPHRAQVVSATPERAPRSTSWRIRLDYTYTVDGFVHRGRWYKRATYRRPRAEVERVCADLLSVPDRTAWTIPGVPGAVCLDRTFSVPTDTEYLPLILWLDALLALGIVITYGYRRIARSDP